MSLIREIQKILKENFEIDFVIMINENFMKCIEALWKIALDRTDEIKMPILRFLQIEEKLRGIYNFASAGDYDCDDTTTDTISSIKKKNPDLVLAL